MEMDCITSPSPYGTVTNLSFMISASQRSPLAWSYMIRHVQISTGPHWSRTWFFLLLIYPTEILWPISEQWVCIFIDSSLSQPQLLILLVATRHYPILPTWSGGTDPCHDGRPEKRLEGRRRRYHLPARSKYLVLAVPQPGKLLMNHVVLTLFYMQKLTPADISNRTRTPVWPLCRVFCCHGRTSGRNIRGSSEAGRHDNHGSWGTDSGWLYSHLMGERIYVNCCDTLFTMRNIYSVVDLAKAGCWFTVFGRHGEV